MRSVLKKGIRYIFLWGVFIFIIIIAVAIDALADVILYFERKQKHKHKFKLTKITIGAYDDIPVMKCNCQSYLVGTHVKTQEQFYEYINRFLN